ncbi:Citrinin biosynthesis transcriptional activator ctnR [Lachnellula suecica]|uniref:Citrinin biosynthesis transcriptional activator ctnR n=1 Tax=Lachnellula suecica TaxID=602035 RepID=A0A8T9C1F9_9HELO|nr:Citrinin biosynthesis transcriptional activator ctnR [Lachnellula suecica]
MPGGEDNGAGSASAAAGQASNHESATKAAEKTISCVSCRKRKLKCDRLKPKCATCVRLRHECEYPERRRNLGSRRRNMKELEERLAQVETKLVAEQNMAGKTQYSSGENMDADWNFLADNMDIPLDDAELLNEPLVMQTSGFGFEGLMPSLPMGDPFSHELIGLGLQEPLPPQDVIDDLYTIYFEKFHSFIPMMHKLRFFASLDRAPHMRPPTCLLYAMWLTAASLSEKYASYEDLFYERTRRYLQAAEMHGHGEQFVSIYHAQTWGLTAWYEAKKTFFSRSWMSTGRMARLVQMLGLHRLDGEGQDVKMILPPPRDWIEREERRRTFWAAFYGDRWASSGTGWPMSINEKEIMTNLPAPEESFERGIEHPTVSLDQALAGEGASKWSPYAGVILSAALFGHNFQHLHGKDSDERPDDISNGQFWKRHRKMDNVLSNTFLFLPDHLRLPYGLREMNVVFIHMNIHSSTICLHQAAVRTAKRYHTGSNIIRQSSTRSLMAAEEISNIMRLVSHTDASLMNSWIGFCLYVAAGVFLSNTKSEDAHPQSIANLEFLLAAMRALSKRHPITTHFVAQLELDIQASTGQKPALSSILDSSDILETGFPKKTFITSATPNVPMNGLIVEREGQPTTMAELFLTRPEKKKNQPPWYGAMPSEQNSQSPPDVNSIPTTASGNTPSSESSSSNTRQFPYRQSDSSTHKATAPSLWPPEGTGFFSTPDWGITQAELDSLGNQQIITDANPYLDDTLWNQDSGHL